MPDSPAQHEERSLRAAVLAGDDSAWRALFVRHFGSLYGYVWSQSGHDKAWSEDVVQEVWLVAVKNLRDFDPGRGTFIAWLRGIADKVMHNERRRLRRRATVELGADAPAPAASAEGDDRRETIALTYALLPRHYQDVLRAKYEDRLAIAEIAAMGGTTSKAVESLLVRARRAFREAYEMLTGETDP